MDLQLVALIALIIGVAMLATRTQSGSWPGRPGWEYRRVFSAGFAGLLLLVAGLIGWDLKYVRGFFQGTKWVNDPIWWQVGLGSALLLLAIFWARRVPSAPGRRLR